jgi:anaerobic glycerol-3-phosphate dehydrogenase
MLVGAMALLYGLHGRDEAARQLFAELEELSRTVSVPPLAFALACLGLGDERVFDWLAKAIDARDPAVTQMPSLPFYDGIRGDPQFTALLERMGLT